MEPEILNLAEDLFRWAEDLRQTGEAVLPPGDCVFRALELTPPEKVRCVILGQDPYPTVGVANGLAFSANRGQKIPASLRNIYRELSEDLGCPVPKEPDLSPWARQGVLLLNAVLTVRAGAPQSHASWGWQRVTGEILRICLSLSYPTAFLLWGGKARETAFRYGLSREDPRAICSSHPSPLGARKGSPGIPAFLGSRPFSRANGHLVSQGAEPIRWAVLD